MIEHIPEKLDYDYKFEKKIGEGTTGETWLARHRFTNKLVAVKCLRLDKIEDAKTLELFERESELLKSVHVEGVPAFYDYYAPTDKGSGFLVQEYIQAPSIQNLLDQNYRFTDTQILDIAERVATILYHLETEYQPPIIHRDIKPSNILYRQSDGVVFLIDFGSVANPQKRTGGSTVAGTFGYMPPEQIMGNVEIQSDYYALGATLIHMLTGIPPYELDSEMFKIDVERAFKDNNIETTSDIIHLLSVLLQPDPEKRPENALALLDLIQCTRTPHARKLNLKTHLSTFFKRIVTWLLPIRTRTTSDNVQHNVLPQNTDGKLLTIQELENNPTKYYGCKFVTRNWLRCDGLIRKYTLLKINAEVNNLINALEYTFEAQDNVWCGLCLAENVKLERTFPIKCSVLYNPDDPRENGLEFIYDNQP